MLKSLLIVGLLLLFLLSGCGANNLENEANHAARVAIENGNFTRGSLLLVAGCNKLHDQSLHLLRMMDHYLEGDVNKLVIEWVRLTRHETNEDFIRLAAKEFMMTISNNQLK